MSRLSVSEIRERLRENSKARRLISRRKRRECRQRGPDHDELFGGPPIQDRPTDSEREHVQREVAELTAQRLAARPVVIGDRAAELAERARIDAENAESARSGARLRTLKNGRARSAVRVARDRERRESAA